MSARSGAIILSVLGISVGSFAVVVFATGFGVKSTVFRTLQEREHQVIEKYEEGELSQGTSDYVVKLYENIQVFYPHILTTGLMFGLLYFLINLLMLFGIVKNYSWLILPWLVMTMACLISQTTGVLCYALYLALKGHLFDALIYFLLYCPLLLIGLYLWFVVYSVHSNIKKRAFIVYDLTPVETNDGTTDENPLPKSDPPPPYKESIDVIKY